MSVRITPELAQRVRQFCINEAGAPGFWSIAKLSEIAFERLLAELERHGPGWPPANNPESDGTFLFPESRSDNHHR